MVKVGQTLSYSEDDHDVYDDGGVGGGSDEEYVTTMMTKLSMDGGSTMWVTRGCSCPVPLQQVAAALHNFTLGFAQF